MSWRSAQVRQTREENRHWLPSQGVDPAPLTELNAECLGLLVMRAAESETARILPPLLAALHDQWAGMSAHAVRRLAAAPFALFDAGLGLRAALARSARTRCSRPGWIAASPATSSLLRRARLPAACWFTAGTWRAAGRARRAWCSARLSRWSNRWPPVPCRRSKRPPTAMPMHCGRDGRSVRILARAARGRVSRRRHAPVRAAAWRNPAPCRGYPRGACSVNLFTRIFSLRPSPESLHSWKTGACATQSKLVRAEPANSIRWGAR